MANDQGGEDPEHGLELNSETAGETPGQEPGSADPVKPAPESTEIVEPIDENYKASDEPVVALRPGRPKDSFRKRSLLVISGLIVFFTVITLGTALFAATYLDDSQRNGITTLASDIAKTAIPTLIALLGTAAAWAFKDSEKD